MYCWKVQCHSHNVLLKRSLLCLWIFAVWQQLFCCYNDILRCFHSHMEECRGWYFSLVYFKVHLHTCIYAVNIKKKIIVMNITKAAHKTDANKDVQFDENNININDILLHLHAVSPSGQATNQRQGKQCFINGPYCTQNVNGNLRHQQLSGCVYLICWWNELVQWYQLGKIVYKPKTFLWPRSLY